jgi:hypothetical protein
MKIPTIQVFLYAARTIWDEDFVTVYLLFVHFSYSYADFHGFPLASGTRIDLLKYKFDQVFNLKCYHCFFIESLYKNSNLFCFFFSIWLVSLLKEVKIKDKKVDPAAVWCSEVF